MKVNDAKIIIVLLIMIFSTVVINLFMPILSILIVFIFIAGIYCIIRIIKQNMGEDEFSEFINYVLNGEVVEVAPQEGRSIVKMDKEPTVEGAKKKTNKAYKNKGGHVSKLKKIEVYIGNIIQGYMNDKIKENHRENIKDEEIKVVIDDVVENTYKDVVNKFHIEIEDDIIGSVYDVKNAIEQQIIVGTYNIDKLYIDKIADKSIKWCSQKIEKLMIHQMDTMKSEILSNLDKYFTKEDAEEKSKTFEEYVDKVISKYANDNNIQLKAIKEEIAEKFEAMKNDIDIEGLRKKEG